MAVKELRQSIDMMECKLLEKQDVALMRFFVDDQQTQYSEAFLNAFLEAENAYGYVIKAENAIVGFAYGYALVRPDGKKDFYLHAMDVMEKYQSRGCGTALVKYIHAHSKRIGCRKMFLITNRSNSAACRCYEKAGGISAASDDAVYVYRN